MLKPLHLKWANPSPKLNLKLPLLLTALNSFWTTLNRYELYCNLIEKILIFEQIAKDQVMRVVENGRMVEKVTYDPLGLILNISAWNYPYFVGSNVWIPALLTGR